MKCTWEAMSAKNFGFKRREAEATYLGQTGTVYLSFGIWVREGPESSVNMDNREGYRAWNLTHRVIV